MAGTSTAPAMRESTHMSMVQVVDEQGEQVVLSEADDDFYRSSQHLVFGAQRLWLLLRPGCRVFSSLRLLALLFWTFDLLLCPFLSSALSALPARVTSPSSGASHPGVRLSLSRRPHLLTRFLNVIRRNSATCGPGLPCWRHLFFLLTCWLGPRQ